MSFASRPLSHTKPNLSLKNISYISKLSTTSSNSRDLFHSKTSSQYHSSATAPSNVITKHANINLCKYSYQSNTKKNCMTKSYSFIVQRHTNQRYILQKGKEVEVKFEV